MNFQIQSKANNYYPFGMVTPGRSFAAGSGYRFGFNGKESDPESYGSGNIYDYGFRIYNPRLGKFLSVDPLTGNYPWYTPYQFAGNMPIWAIDRDGLEPAIATDWAMKVATYLAKLSTRTSDYVEQKNDINNPINNPDYNHDPAIRQAENNELDAKAINYSLKVTDDVVQGTIDAASTIPAVETIGDVINVVYNYTTGDYAEAKISLAALVIPGVSSSMLRGLKGAYQMATCTDFAESFVKKIGPMVEEAGAIVKKHEFNTDLQFGIGYIGKEQSITTNGRHQVIEVIKDGESYIFDNIYSEGILKSEWEKGFEVVNSKGVLHGSDVWKASKEVN